MCKNVRLLPTKHGHGTIINAYTHKLGCVVQEPTYICDRRAAAHAHLYMEMCAGHTYPGPTYRCVMLCTHSSQIHGPSYLQMNVDRHCTQTSCLHVVYVYANAGTHLFKV